MADSDDFGGADDDLSDEEFDRQWDAWWNSLSPQEQAAHEARWAAEEARERRALAGRHRLYEWRSPVGTFSIYYLSNRPVGHEWQLSIDDLQLRSYADPVDAMYAVCQRQSGHRPWDDFKGPVTLPEDEKDWRGL